MQILKIFLNILKHICMYYDTSILSPDFSIALQNKSSFVSVICNGLAFGNIAPDRICTAVSKAVRVCDNFSAVSNVPTPLFCN